MAAIDKTYINDWDTFNTIRNWGVKQRIPVKDGSYVNLRDYMYYPDLTKEQWDEMKGEYEKRCDGSTFDVVLWNTPTYVDVWLIKNCPFDAVQDRLKEQYGGGWSKQAFTSHNHNDMYTQIKEGRSIYDTYQRNGLGKKSKVIFHHLSGSWCRDKKCWWWIDVNPRWIGNKRIDRDKNYPFYWYNEDTDGWYTNEELVPTTTNVCTTKDGALTRKNVVNLIKKWNFPKGTIIKFENLMSIKGNRYLMHSFWCEVK